MIILCATTEEKMLNRLLLVSTDALRAIGRSNALQVAVQSCYSRSKLCKHTCPLSPYCIIDRSRMWSRERYIEFTGKASYISYKTVAYSLHRRFPHTDQG